jgi:hypothetical protein
VIARKDGERVRLWARTTSDYSNNFTRILLLGYRVMPKLEVMPIFPPARGTPPHRHKVARILGFGGPRRREAKPGR